MEQGSSSPVEIPQGTPKKHGTISAPAGFSICAEGPSLSSTGERQPNQSDNNAFERVPIPTKTTLQTQKTLSALGSQLNESNSPFATDASAWINSSFGTSLLSSNKSIETLKSNLTESTNMPQLISPEGIGSNTWDATFTTNELKPFESPSNFITLPRMSRDEHTEKKQFARRSFSTKSMNSPSQILVKKKVSDNFSSRNNSSVSPVTSESFSSLGMSPAISFLSSFAEPVARN